MERLTVDDDTATRLHYNDGEVWLDTDIGIRIGCGQSRREAVDDARTELRERVVDLVRADRQQAGGL